MLQKQCKYCKKIIYYNYGKEFSCHCASCKANPNVVAKYKKASTTLHKKIYDKYNIKCLRCNKSFELEITKYKYKKGKYRKHCTRTCANVRLRTKEIKRKIREALTTIRKINCLYCDIELEINKASKRIFCSTTCRGRHKTREAAKYWDELTLYRKKCDFKFNFWNFPNEYKLDLIKKYGWYKAKNHGNNQNGISRDHMVSVMYGFKNNINADIISHPANCQLLRHKQNVSKRDKCSLTLNELKNRIKTWNRNYGVIV